jgi:subtilase family serine protease
MRLVKSTVPALLITLSFFSGASYAATPDRIKAEINSSQMVELKGNVHGLAQPRFDLGRADSSKMMHEVTLAFRPSTAQQQDLDTLLAQQQDRSSPNYHKWLTPAQFADRFGMTRGDIQRVTGWLQSQGFAVTSVANSRNEISFDGTVSQVEVSFHTEIHNYMVGSEVHFANATNPSVPAALAGSALSISHLHDFAPKPRAKIRPHLTSYISGNHFMAPGDFATIYDVAPLYAAGSDGTGQKIAIVGQSSVSTSDLNNFRSAAGLSANTPTILPALSGTTSTRCPGDEGESDLDLEWSGGVAKNASIIFVYAGLAPGDTCTGGRTISVWDALDYAVQHNVAPFISTSYGACEDRGTGQLGATLAFAQQIRGWVQQANSQGQTVVAASGDSGAADCDPNSTDQNDTSATQGLAVDVPASIPEVTGMGGNTFTGDSPTYTTPNPPGANPPYWAAAGATADTVSSALEYIPEDAWNDTTADLKAGGTLSASGGGASIFFLKPTWQTGTGVPADGQRDVPDVSIAASPNHDGYLICSEDSGTSQTQASCVAGFRDAAGANGSFTVVGGTSVAAPTFSAILALINQSLGSPGLGNVNPNLYQFASSSPSAFHDVTVGNNDVPCMSGTLNCPAGTTQIGFSAGTGYDQVTGLGSVDADKLATAWGATTTSSSDFTLASTAASFAVTPGASVNATVNVTFNGSFSGIVTFTCTDPAPGSICTIPPQINAAGQVSFNVTTTAPTVGSLRPSDQGMRIFYALLVPGLLGLVFTAGSRRRSLRGMRFLGLVVVLGLSTLWLASCGGNANRVATGGTTPGNYSITVKGTSGTASSSTTFQLVVQ